MLKATFRKFGTWPGMEAWPEGGGLFKVNGIERRLAFVPPGSNLEQQAMKLADSGQAAWVVLDTYDYPGRYDGDKALCVTQILDPDTLF